MIEIRNVNFHYQGLEQAGLDDVNLTIGDGETVLLCGASGCGKTTVTRLVNGLIPHYYKGELEGNVLVNGRDISETMLYDLAGVVGSVFQNPRSQFFSVDTDGEIVFGPENIGLPKDEILGRKEEIVQELNLQELLDRSLFELSGGEKQKIACASVAALLPEIIILDEPSSNLDWNAIRDLQECIRLWKSQGKTVIVSEHRLWYIRDVIDRAVYLRDGRIEKQWNKEEFEAMSEEELAKYELRPVHLEERLIRQFSQTGSEPDPKSDCIREETGGPGREAGTESDRDASDRVILQNFYFTYHMPKYFFVKKKLTPADADICELAIPKVSVKEHTVTGIIGQNGSGKSTFLRCLCGLEKNCIGTVTAGGRTLAGKDLTKLCYMVMQDVNHQLFTDSVRAEVMLSMEKEDEAACDEILARLDILQYADKHPMALSGGQKQRVAIASAVAAGAEILLFDEPTSGLDYGHMKEVSGLIRSLADSGHTIFVSTHDPELVSQCCDQTLRIERGRVTGMDSVLKKSSGDMSSPD